MTITDQDTEEVYYDTGEDESFAVSGDFWEELIEGNVSYMSGGEEDDVEFSESQVLALSDPKFEDKFREMYESVIGNAVMTGLFPTDMVM